jgi:hypothetical protein
LEQPSRGDWTVDAHHPVIKGTVAFEAEVKPIAGAAASAEQQEQEVFGFSCG